MSDHTVITIGGVGIGGDHPCRTVFEVSNAHNGDLALAHRLIDGAKSAGADFVKLQAYTADELVALRGDGPAPDPWGTQGWSMHALYTHAATPLAWLPELFQHARDIGIVPFASVFGRESLAACEAVQCPAYKIAALDNGHDWLQRMVVNTDRPVLVSVRRAQRAALQSTEEVRYLLCEAGYPTPAASFALQRGDFTAYGEVGWYDVPDYLGLSSHCLAPELPIAAVARGCKLIEMHGMLDEVPSALESHVSLTVSDFRRMVRSVRATEALLA